MKIIDVLNKEKGKYKGCIVNGIVTNGFTEKSINRIVAGYEIKRNILYLTTLRGR